MIILLNKQLKCDHICKVINNYLAKELKEVKDLSNYALTLSLSEIKESEISKVKLLNKS